MQKANGRHACSPFASIPCMLNLAFFISLRTLKDGLIILQAFDKILPGSVICWRVLKPKQGAGMVLYASGGSDEDEGADISGGDLNVCILPCLIA